MAKGVEASLVGAWRHSHEEDTEAEAVYRPEGYAFPPSRGRMGYELRPDHSATRIGIAARDGAAPETATWELKDGPHPELVLTLGNGRREVLRVVSVDRTRLVVRKRSG